MPGFLLWAASNQPAKVARLQRMLPMRTLNKHLSWVRGTAIVERPPTAIFHLAFVLLTTSSLPCGLRWSGPVRRAEGEAAKNRTGFAAAPSESGKSLPSSS